MKTIIFKVLHVLLGLFMVIYTGMHLLTWALIRYRLPVDAILLIFAAVGIMDILKRFNVRNLLRFQQIDGQTDAQT